MRELALVSASLDKIDEKMKAQVSFSSTYVKGNGPALKIGKEYVAILEQLQKATSTKGLDKEKYAAYRSIAEQLAVLTEHFLDLPAELSMQEQDFLDLIKSHLVSIRQVVMAVEEHQKKLVLHDPTAIKLHLKVVLEKYVDERTMFKVFLLIFQVKRVLRIPSPKARRAVAKKG